MIMSDMIPNIHDHALLILLGLDASIAKPSRLLPGSLTSLTSFPADEAQFNGAFAKYEEHDT